MSDSDEEPYNSMDEVLPGLWIGDISSAIDAETLRARKIHSVLTAMRGRVKIGEQFSHYQIQLDDVEDADALAFFPQCISFIESELEKGRGVLVHCQAGMSRSVTIVAAYLMYAQNQDATTALDIIRQVRPSMCPNDGFLQQLDIFYQASYKVSRRDKATRMYYLERAVLDILNGDGSIPEDNMFAKFPRTPSDSIPSTPAGAPKRKIRCKMCRQELANREHMLDHGQVGPPTPAVIGGLSPAVSRRPSMHDPTMTHPSRSSVFPLTPLTALSRRSSSTAVQTLTSTTFPLTPGSATTHEIAPLARSRRPSSSSVIAEKGNSLSRRPSNTVQQSRSRLGSSTDLSGTLASPLRASMLPTDKASFLRGIKDSLSMSALESDEDSEVAVEVRSPGPSTISAAESRLAMEAGSDHFMERIQETDAEMGDSDKPLLVQSPEPLGLAGRGTHTGVVTSVSATSLTEMSPSEPNTQTLTQVTGTTPSSALHHPPTLSSSSSYFHPHDLAAQLNTNPKLAALRGRSLSGSGSVPPMTKISNAQTPSVTSSLSPPLLINPKCSGYFVEPMKWMESFLEDGRLAGKIICPNKKCGAKLGNYDWAGVCCSCKEWVTPGFCIHRSKVDEII